ncbi:hypothetical protein [Aquimarina sp. 2201CG5-10]|uniref:hypothetical protein n=1 Tax=Aquimarina callyspongiae TaxID=3098150 RepID=UPI002AB51D81|nr:hypothetical protein [Aquimarina sp. 2201CG5-10]MDY8138414.1 hypothetical protein [Aquimarina sp. 2201CG5-10]
MKITQNILEEIINIAMIKGYLEVVDQRKNVLTLKDGIFTYNGEYQSKSIEAIRFYFLEAFKLSRNVTINKKKYQRERSDWRISKKNID